MNFLENFSVNKLKLKLILMKTFYDALAQRIYYNSRRGFTSDAAADYQGRILNRTTQCIKRLVDIHHVKIIDVLMLTGKGAEIFFIIGFAIGQKNDQ